MFAAVVVVGVPELSLLKDNLGRYFYYLRLSITDLCNFSCSYCLPDGCLAATKKQLSLLEIEHLLIAFAELGVSKVRITGGGSLLYVKIVLIL